VKGFLRVFRSKGAFTLASFLVVGTI